MIVASNTKKMIAKTIDFFLVCLINLVVLKCLSQDIAEAESIIFFEILTITYVLIFTSGSRNTLGRQLMKIKILKENKIQMSLKDAALRYLFSLASGFLIFVGYFIAIFHNKKLTLHDRMAHTCVFEI